MATDQPSPKPKKHHHVSLAGGSLLLAISLAAWEVYFFWGPDLIGSGGLFGLFSSDRLGFNMSWLVLFYLAYQLVSIPLAPTPNEHNIGILDGLASVVPLMVAAIAIFDYSNVLKTPSHWEVSILLLLMSLVDLVGGYAMTLALNRRTMIGFGGSSS